MMDNDNHLISILRASSADPQAKKLEDFRRNEKQIREAIADGWQLINIWNYLKKHDEFSGSYPSFRRYVKKIIEQNTAPCAPVSKKQKPHVKNEKRLSAELAEKTLGFQSSESRRNQKTLALFLGKQDEIREAIDVGYRVKTIWKTLLEIGAFEAGYNCFAWYVRKYITGEDIDSSMTHAAFMQEKNDVKLHITNSDNSSSSRKPDAATKMPDKKHTEKASGGFEHFIYNPASIDKDSLI